MIPKLQFPLEIYDASKIEGRLQEITPVTVLFPSYMPKVSKQSQLYPYIKHLSTSKKHVSAILARYEKTNLYALISDKHEVAYNHYLFPNTSPQQVAAYIERYQGWTPKLFKRIQWSQKHDCFRLDRDESLYEWEAKTIKSLSINFKLANEIIEKELQLHAIHCDYSISQITSKVKLGSCAIHRRSGWLSRPFYLDFSFAQKEPNLHIVLHEIAHALDAHYFRTQNHGPTFMLLYRDLLNKYFNIDYLQSMIDYGLLNGQGK